MNSNLANIKIVLRGYDPETVEQAWNELENQLAQTNATSKELRLQLNSLQEQNNEWSNRLKVYEKMESDLRDALLSAQRIANQVQAEANQQAQARLTEAQQEAETLVEDAQRFADTKSAELEQQLIERQITLQTLKEEIQTLRDQEQELSSVMSNALVHFQALQALLAIAKKEELGS